MIARAIPKTGPKRCTLLYVEDHADSVLLVDTLLAARKDLLSGVEPRPFWATHDKVQAEYAPLAR